ncbi:hypothetical protein QL285_023061 [Trifolium repens]|nr:hypothetical protein QL285_023061 [Trifolium repens]
MVAVGNWLGFDKSLYKMMNTVGEKREQKDRKQVKREGKLRNEDSVKNLGIYAPLVPIRARLSCTSYHIHLIKSDGPDAL